MENETNLIRQRHHQRGFTLFEALLVLGIVAIIAVPLVGTLAQLSSTTRILASQAAIHSRTRYLVNDVRETLTNAGTGIKNVAGDRLVIADTSKTAQPAVFVDESGSVLTVLVTNETGAGTIITGAGTTKLVLDNTSAQWTNLPANSYVMAVNAVGPPAILQLTASPRPATDGEIPNELGTYNLNQTAVLQVVPASEFFGIRPLTTTYTDAARLVPIVRVVRYATDQNGIQRDEFVAGAGDYLGGPHATGNKTFIAPMTPGLVATIAFSYVTIVGRTQKLPGDTTTLRGIHVQMRVTDPATNYSEGDGYDCFVDAWQ